MPIRFPCPACRQPLEVDSDWAGQTVACPYCRRVITAPTASTWPAGGIPVAAPAQPQPGGFAPPPPPPGYPAAGPPPRGRAGKALALAIAGASCSALAFLLFMISLWSELMRRAGMNASPAEYQRLAEEMASSGQIPLPTPIAYLVLLAAAGSLGGLVLGARSLARQESGRRTAITACILGALFLICPMIWALPLMAARLGG